MIPSYLAPDIFLSFNRELPSATFPDVIDPMVNLVEVRSPGIPPYSFVSTMEPRLHHDDRNSKMKTSMSWIDLFEKSNYDREELLEFRNQIPSPL